jgi:hypothetical protein
VVVVCGGLGGSYSHHSASGLALGLIDEELGRDCVNLVSLVRVGLTEILLEITEEGTSFTLLGIELVLLNLAELAAGLLVSLDDVSEKGCEFNLLLGQVLLAKNAAFRVAVVPFE